MDQGANLSIIIPNYKERQLMSVYGQCQLLFPKAQIILQDDLEGKGKGWAMREGLKKATKEMVCFLDGDMDIHPNNITRLWAVEDSCVIIGKRVYKASVYRKIISYGYRFMTRLLFGLTCDTQSGLKLFNRFILPQWETDGFAYDIEILAKLRKDGWFIKEVPVLCNIIGSKTPKKFMIAIWETFIETLRVWKRVR